MQRREKGCSDLLDPNLLEPNRQIFEVPRICKEPKWLQEALKT